MKTILVIIFLGLTVNHLTACPFSPREKQDTVVVVTDSLDWYRYHVSQMTLLLEEKPVHYTVIFDTTTNRLKPQYQQIGGAILPYDAIRKFGEKYRTGVLFYNKWESEGNNE